ncbi:MAG: porphobilinogen synthase, partial [Gemmatimonadales bacterium]
MHRLRRLRHHPGLRALVRENRLDPSDFILPVFVTEVDPQISPIASMPGVSRWPISHVAEIALAADRMGLGGVLLFGIPAHKDATGSEASAEHGVVQRAIRQLRASGHEGVIVADVCLCEYTDTGHCGILDQTGALVEHATNARLAATALSLAAAGADMVAPSAMMDGMVKAIREALDTRGFETVPVMA